MIGLDACTTGAAAASTSTSGVSIGCSDTVSSSWIVSGSASASDAATSVTTASLNAGACTNDTSIIRAAVTCITPSLTLNLSICAPTLSPSLRPSEASTKASEPAVVLETLNVPVIPPGVT